MMRFFLASLCTVLVALAGCSESVTQVIVLIDAEPGIREDATALQVRVEGRDSRSDEGVVKLDAPVILTDNQRWPVRLAMRPLKDDVTRVFAVEVLARDGNTTIATARIVSGYVEGQVRYAKLLLEDACRGMACNARPDETCRGGMCVIAYVDPQKLSKDPNDTSDSDAGDAMMSMPDASDDGGDDAATVDAGSDASADASTDAGSDAAIDAGCGMPEECNGLDDDCDEEIDEDLTRSCGTDVGTCTAGTETCVNETWTGCTGTSPGTETGMCDGIDSDCDGKTDESLGCLVGSVTHAFAPQSSDAYDVVVNQAGTIFATGYQCDEFTSESCDLWVAAFSTTGTELWKVVYDNGFSGYQYFLQDVGHGIALDPQGNVVGFGRVCDSGTEESCDLWLRKLNPSTGATVGNWDLTIDVGAEMQLGTETQDDAADVIVAADGSVYIAASVRANTDPSSIWVRKYNSSGVAQWDEMFDSLGSYTDAVAALAVDGAGNLFVAGYVNNNEAWVRKYAPNKTARWTRSHTVTGTNAYARTTGVAVDSESNVLTVGTDYDGTAESIWIEKRDSDGNLIDSTTIGTRSDGQVGPDITVDADDNVIVGLATFVTGLARDLRVYKYSSDLSLVWSRSLSTTANEFGHAVATASNGSIVVVGSVEDEATNALNTLVRIYNP